MARYSGKTITNARPTAPTVAVAPARTHENGEGHVKDDKTALWTLAVTYMGDTTFYESADARGDRVARLVARLTATDPTWVAGLARWLRHDANMRTVPVVIACEYVAAGGPNGRSVVDSVCVRADEPGEVLGYWLTTRGRSVPWALRRGLADAARRLYNEKAVLKYDTATHGVRFADVLEIAHVESRRGRRRNRGRGLVTDTAVAAEIERRAAGGEIVDRAEAAAAVRAAEERDARWRGPLYDHLLDRRHGRASSEDTLAPLGLLRRAYALDATPVEARRAALRLAKAGDLADAGYTWERLSGWLPGGMDAEAWEAIVPTLGYMALLRNLRNLEDAGVSSAVLDRVAERLADPGQVARSRQFPYRFWFAWPLEQALEHSVANVPVLSGRTLVMCDTSGSMTAPVAARSKVQRVEVAALFAAAVAARSDVVLCPYANTTYRATVQRSVLRTVEDIRGQIDRVGGGTNTWPCTAAALSEYGPFDRVVVFSDMQDHSRWGGARPPAGLPVYVWDLAGYAAANVDTSVRGHYLFGGFTDAAFRLIGLLEAGRNAAWPWEQTAA